MKSWLLVMVMGCGARPAEPLESPTPLQAPHEVVTLAAPRPAIDTTDTTPDLGPFGRWPLTIAEHPELDPHFPVSDALAQPGISWQDLCARGAQFRHMSQNAELGDYLAAWCSVAKEDYTDALYRLGLVPKTPKLKSAIEMDAVAILAAGIPGNEAEGALRHASLIELHIVDLAAASYFEVGKLEDAYSMNRLAMDMDRTATAETSCTRLLRAAADGTDSQRWIALEELAHRAYPKDKDAAKGQCIDLANEFACGDRTHCESEAMQKRDAFITLKGLADAWPSAGADFAAWMHEVRTSRGAWPPDQAYRIAVPALELAVRTSRCTPSWLDEIEATAVSLETMPNPNFDRMRATAGTNTTSIRIKLEGDMLPFVPRLQAIIEQSRIARNGSYERCVDYLASLPPVTP